MRTEFKLDPTEVSVLFRNGISEGRSGQLTKQSRAQGRTSCTVELTHKPTGVKVSEEIPRGYYSRQEMIKRRKLIRDKLFVELEKRVPVFLRMPGL